MKITLISPRLALQKGDFLGSGVLYWPLELAVLAAVLRRRGETVSVIDLLGEAPFELEERPDHYLQGRPLRAFAGAQALLEAEAFVVYACSYMSHAEVLDITAALKRLSPSTPVAVLENSQAVTAYALPETAADFFTAGADALICGEACWNWDEIQAFLLSPAAAPIPSNLLARRSPAGTVVVRRTPATPSYPAPAWELFKPHNYWALPYAHGPKTPTYLPILTSRGCPYRCDFCVAPATNHSAWRGRSPGEVVAEMIELRDRFGVSDFQVEDLNPTVDSSRWEAICRLLIEKKAGIRYYFASGTKAETISIDALPLYAGSGCRYISISPESGSPAVLKAVGKPFDHERALSLIAACRALGIATQACLIVGHSAEDAQARTATLTYLRRMVRAGLDEVAIFVTAPLPGSRLFAGDALSFSSKEALLSFSPTGRTGWEELSRWRGRLIRTFFIEKLKRGPDLWLQGWRALIGHPRTKMENLPRRIIWIFAFILRHRLSVFLGGGAQDQGAFERRRKET